MKNLGYKYLIDYRSIREVKLCVEEFVTEYSKGISIFGHWYIIFQSTVPKRNLEKHFVQFLQKTFSSKFNAHISELVKIIRIDVSFVEGENVFFWSF